MARNEVKWGSLLSYLLIIVNAVYGLLITPYVLSSIGDIEYGIYKTISSLSTSLMVLDLGLGGTLMRYIAKYNSEKKFSKIESFISMALAEGAILIGIISLCCGVLYTTLPTMYSSGLNGAEMNLAKQLFIIMSVNMVLHVVENLLGGIITGYNHFTFGNGMKFLRIVFRMVLIYVLFIFIKSALVLVLIDLALTVILLIVEYIYIRCVLHTRMRLSFSNWDKEVFKESFRYTGLLFLTTIAIQVNSNLDNVVIGAISGPEFVTVYSMGLLFFGMFENLSMAISGVMLPTVTNILNKKDGLQKVQNIIIKVGRFQFVLLGAAFTGFAILGDDFIKLWLGDGYKDVYIITLILMGPSLLELCVNVCTSVLRAKNMLFFRTAVLTGATVLNAIITIVGVYMFGYFAAAIGTAVSFVLGSLVIMNIYYYKKLSFRMIHIYRKIFSGTWLCLILAGGATLLLSHFYVVDSWLAFIINVAVFAIVYGMTLLIFGLKKDEKKSIPVLNKFFK